MAFFSLVTYTGDGATTSFPVPFPYLQEAHVLVSVDSQIVGYSFTSPSQITFNAAPAADAVVSFQRSTPADGLLATIQGRSVLKSAELNLVYTQLLYIMQEVFDVGEGLEGSTIEVATALAQIQAIQTAVEASETAAAASAASANTIASAIAYQYDMVFSIPYVPVNGDRVATIPMVRPVTLPVNAVGSRGETYSAAADGDAIFSIRKNDVEVGTITFAVASATPTFSVPTATDFDIGDDLSIVCTQADLTLRNLGVTLQLQRNGSIA